MVFVQVSTRRRLFTALALLSDLVKPTVPTTAPQGLSIQLLNFLYPYFECVSVFLLTIFSDSRL